MFLEHLYWQKNYLNGYFQRFVDLVAFLFLFVEFGGVEAISFFTRTEAGPQMALLFNHQPQTEDT